MDNPFNYNLVPMDPLMGMGVTMGIPMEFQNDPISYLSAIASTSPSYQAWEKLSGPVAYWFHEGKKKRKKSGDKDINNDNNDDVEDIDNDNNNNNNDNEDTPNDDFPTNREEEQSVLASYAPVAAAYLHAAAVHLELLLTTTTTNNSSSSRGIDTGRTEMNSVRTRAQDEIVETVGVCATLCKDRRGAISSSGILPVLGRIILDGRKQKQEEESPLSKFDVEFLQCALLAEQYRYAARLIEGTWPRPDAKVDVHQVLRYYYLRGMIHLSCDDYIMAHRCFWTCLCIPAEIVSKTAVEAWKKLALVQCVMNKGLNGDERTKILLPKAMPTCLGRLLNTSADDSFMNVPSSVRAKSTTTKPSELLSEMELDRKKSPTDAESTACYLEITTAFFARDGAKLKSLMTEHELTLRKDGNLGLTQDCLTKLTHDRVRRLSKMYSVVSLVKLATILGIPSGKAMEEEVTALLIQSGVPCEIHEDGMIEFPEIVEEAAGPASLLELSKWMSLLETVQRLDFDFWTNPSYQSLAKKDATSTAAGALGSLGALGVDELQVDG